MNRIHTYIVILLIGLLLPLPGRADDESSGSAISVESRVADSELVVIATPIAAKFITKKGYSPQCVSVTFRILETLKGSPLRTLSVASCPYNSAQVDFSAEDAQRLKNNQPADHFLLFLISTNNPPYIKATGFDPRPIAPWMLGDNAGDGDVWSSMTRLKPLGDTYNTGENLPVGLTKDPFNTQLRRTNTYADLLTLVRQAIAWEKAHPGSSTKSVWIAIDWNDVVPATSSALRPDIYSGPVSFPTDARTQAMVRPWLTRSTTTKIAALEVLANFPSPENTRLILPLLHDPDTARDDTHRDHKGPRLTYPVREATAKVLDMWRVPHPPCPAPLPLDHAASFGAIGATLASLAILCSLALIVFCRRFLFITHRVIPHALTVKSRRSSSPRE